MITVDLAQAKARLSELLDQVEAGQEVLSVTRRATGAFRSRRTLAYLSPRSSDWRMRAGSGG